MHFGKIGNVTISYIEISFIFALGFRPRPGKDEVFGISDLQDSSIVWHWSGKYSIGKGVLRQVSGCRPDRDINTNMIYQMYYMNAL